MRGKLSPRVSEKWKPEPLVLLLFVWLVGWFSLFFFSAPALSLLSETGNYDWKRMLLFFIPVFLRGKKRKLGVVKEKNNYPFFFSFLTEKASRRCLLWLKMQFIPKQRDSIENEKRRFNRMHLPLIQAMKCWQPASTLWVFYLLSRSSASIPAISYWLHCSECLETPTTRKPKPGLDAVAFISV